MDNPYAPGPFSKSRHRPPVARWRRGMLLLGPALLLLMAAQSVPAQCERMVGIWSWFINGDVTFKADHTLTQGRLTGRWTCDPVNSKVHIDWSHGFQDDLQLSADGQTLSGKNQVRNSVGGRRKGDLPGSQTAPSQTASSSQFQCPAQIGRWPLITAFRAAGDGRIVNSGAVQGGGSLQLSTTCYYKSGMAQPIGALSSGFLNLIHFEWVYPGQPTSWSRCGESSNDTFYYSSSRRALLSLGVRSTEDREAFRNAGLSVLQTQIEPFAEPCGPPPTQPQSTATREPVIFVPGITGSILKSAKDGKVLWPPEYPADPTLSLSNVRLDFLRLSLNPTTQPEDVRIDPRTGSREVIYATDAIRTYLGEQFYGPFLNFLRDPTQGGYVEYDVSDNPNRRTLTSCNLSQQLKPSLFVFAYDWRLAIEHNADRLASYVDCVNKFYPNRKVNIVTHSMGGLVARRYIIDHPAKVNKLITVAAPFLGSAKPLSQMIYGRLDADFSLKGILKKLIFDTEVKDMLEYYPGLHELMLSENYYALGGAPFTRDPDVLLSQPRVEVSSQELMGAGGIIDKLFPNPSYNGKTPAQTNREFHSYIGRDGNKQDDWSRDTSGVKYYHLFGVQRSGDTPQSLRESVLTGPTREKRVYYGLVPVGPGDGTVPQLSAERIVNRRSLNAPNAKMFIYNTSADVLLEHAGIMTNPAVLARVVELLREGETGGNPGIANTLNLTELENSLWQTTETHTQGDQAGRSYQGDFLISVVGDVMKMSGQKDFYALYLEGRVVGNKYSFKTFNLSGQHLGVGEFIFSGNTFTGRWSDFAGHAGTWQGSRVR